MSVLPLIMPATYGLTLTNKVESHTHARASPKSNAAKSSGSGVITLTQISYNEKNKKLRYVFYMKKNSLIYKMSWRKDWGLGSPMGVQF